MKIALKNPDHLGIISSAACLIHCIATPLIFIYPKQILKFSYNDKIIWWQSVSLFIITISFFAVYRSVKNSSNNLIKVLMWLNCSILFGLIINELIEIIELPELLTYLSAISLAILHIINLKYCKCSNDSCCIHKS